MTNPHSSTPTNWQTLAEFSLPGQPDVDQLARDYIAVAVQPLTLSTAELERLKTAVTETVLHGLEQSSRSPSNITIHIRLQISGKPAALPISDSENVLIPASEMPNSTTNRPDQESTRCWGFFLTERMVDDVQIGGENAYYRIELFLYPE